MAQKPKILPGDRIVIEVDVLETWDGEKLTFTLRGYPERITIPSDSKDIVKVIPTAKIRKDMRRG